MPKPVIAAVNGTCVGAGLGIALACDLVVMAAGAKPSGPRSPGIGLTCDSGCLVTLARSLGDRGAGLLLRPGTFTAEEAVSWGLSAELVPARRCARPAAALAARLARGRRPRTPRLSGCCADGPSRRSRGP